MTPVETDSSPIVISRPETSQLASIHAGLMSEAHALVVSDAESHAAGLDLVKRAKQRMNEVEAIFAEPKAAAHRAHKFITAAEKAALTAPEAALKEASTKCADYEEHARKVAEEAARKQQAEARKLEEDRQLADAEAASTPEERDAILNEEVTVPVVAARPEVAKVAGVSSRTIYSATGFDLNAFICHVAGVKRVAHPELVSLLAFNGTALNQIAKAQRENMSLPGVKLNKQNSLAVRTA